MTMRVWLYAIIRNEERLMPYFLRHYAPWVDRLIFYDDESTDNTRQIIATCPKAYYRPWLGSHGIVDNEFTDFANEQWKEAIGKAEWIVWVDADEFLYHPNVLEVLERYLKEGVEVPRVVGYTMFSDHFPTTDGQIYDEIKTGVYDDCWSKNAIFRGNMIWNVGRHSIDHSRFNPKSSQEPELKLLHYRCLGMDYLKERHARNWSRVPEHCRQKNYGTNCSPGWTGHHGVAWFEELSKQQIPNVI